MIPKIYEFIHADLGYRTAVNYDGTNYYNCPLTLVYNNVEKYILPFGTDDSLHVDVTAGYLMIIGENQGLDYISLVNIDTIGQTIVNEVFLNNVAELSEEMGIENIFKLGMDEQFSFLSQWFE